MLTRTIQARPAVASAGAKRRARTATPLTADAASLQALVHELHVHQVELEQQNEELRRTQDELASARDRFVDLFDFAPVGYLTLDRDGRIMEANLTVAAVLGVERQAILDRSFLQYVATHDADRWQRLRARAMRSGAASRTELALRRQGAKLLHAQLDCLGVARPGPVTQLRIALTDISQRELAEKNRRIASSSNDARESERREVAYRLHEDLGQRLSALKMSLSALPVSALAAEDRAVARAMDNELDQALAIVRRISTDLHPLMLHNLGLGAALQWLARDVTKRLGVRVDVHLDGDAPASESQNIAIYRLAEMAMTEMAREVEAHIQVAVLQRPHDVVLQLECDRYRQSQSPDLDFGPGLVEAMRDQVHLIGGRLEFSEQPEGARRMTIMLPFVRAHFA